MRQQQADQLLEDAYYSTIGFSRRKRLADTYSMLLASLGPSTMIHQSRTLPNPIPQVPFEDTLGCYDLAFLYKHFGSHDLEVISILYPEYFYDELTKLRQDLSTQHYFK